MISIFTWLLFFALFYLLATSLIFLRNRFDLTPLPAVTESDENTEKPSISVCIPARNEEQNIGILLKSLQEQDYPDFDIHVLDDHSEDRTFQTVQSFQKKNDDKLFLHKGLEKPEKWLGKSWACHQLGRHSEGEILLFLDADTQLLPGALKGIAAAFDRFQTDMITVWPHQKMDSFWEKTSIPLIYYALITLLPAVYVYRDPRWMPSFLKKKFRSLFAAACGQCIAFRRKAYQKIRRA
jgi:chlorobactene glucosyltransferase